MNALLQFWQERCGLARPLESDSRLHRLLNRYVVAALMNRFPHAATKLFSLSNGELARLLFVEREGGSFRVLRAMYDHQNAGDRGDWINKLLMQSPAIKAARNRRAIAQQMLQQCLEAQPAGLPTLVVAIGGGDGSLEAEVIGRVRGRDIYYCAIDKDDRAVADSEMVLRRHGLAARGFVFVGTVAEERDLAAVLDCAGRRFGVAFDGAGVSVCHGIAEYYDIGSKTNETLAGLLRAIHGCTRAEGSLLISQTDYHDRVEYLERGLSWHMRLRSSDELAVEVAKAGWQISVCKLEPMGLITMCLATRPAAEHVRIDGPGQLKEARVQRPLPAATRRRRWVRSRRR